MLLVLIVVLLLLNSFFSLIETALMESHRSRLERLADEGSEDAAAALAILEEPEDALSVAQIGITLMGVLLGAASGALLAPLMGALLAPFLPHATVLSLALSIVLMTYIMLLFGEFLPKKTAMQKPEEVLLNHHRALHRLTRLSRPLITLLSRSANLILLVLGLNPKFEDTVTEDEVKDLMTPRTQMLWLDLEDSLHHNLRVIRTHAQSIFPVGRENLDDFCGILYAKDLLNAALTHKSLELSQYLRKPMFVPRSMELFRLLEKFRETGIHEAMVLDEYGGVIGMITLDDIMSEVLGDSAHSAPSEPLAITPRDDHSWYVDGLYSIDDFKERFDIDKLPDEDHDHYQTMGGFLTSYFGYIPKVAEKAEWNGFTFEVVDMDRARIDKILVTKNERDEDPAADDKPQD